MELEFDKEINAILRKAGQHAATGPASAASAHIDADMIAAFAENALPDRARPPMIQHFASCDRCRKLLSSSILLNSEAGATAASSAVPAIVGETVLPWYQRLFKMPGMALAMGAIVLTFTGVLAFLVLQNRGDRQTAVSEVMEPQDKRGGPYDSGLTGEGSSSNSTTVQTLNSNAASSNAAMSSNTAARELQPLSDSNAASNSAPPTGRVDAGEAPVIAGTDDRSRAADSVGTGAGYGGAGLPAAAPPPKEPAVDVAKTEADEKKLDNDKLNEQPKDLELAKRKEAEEQRATRDAPAAAAKSGPARSGPMQMKSNQSGNRVYDMSVTRKVGGRSFNNRDGAWYDTGYHGQSTINIGRGTEEFKKLDGGLRSIANNLGGVVVVVWKGKAYRIQ